MLDRYQCDMSDTALSRTPSEIEQSTEKLLRDIKIVVQDGEELLRAGAKDLSERGMAVRERLAVALEAAKSTGSKLEARAAAGAETANRIAHEHPYRSIGIAFGAGIFFGILLNRK